MKNSVCYRLADITIHVQMDFKYDTDKSYMYQYIVPDCENADYEFSFQQINDINVYKSIATNFKEKIQKHHYYQDNEGNEYCFFIHQQYYYAVTVLGEKKGYCYYVSYEWMKEAVNSGYYLENFLCLEKIFIKFQCMVLHSCHIHYAGNAILFSAPSGTGKSTQGELWRVHAGAEVINGDRTAIRKVNGVWKAYGVPFCGTSGIHENKQAPLKGIVTLRQYKENYVTRLKGRNAFYSIYSELTVNRWNQQFVNDAMDWTLELLQDIPVYEFLCTKEAEAVDVLKEYMEG